MSVDLPSFNYLIKFPCNVICIQHLLTSLELPQCGKILPKAPCESENFSFVHVSNYPPPPSTTAPPSASACRDCRSRVLYDNLCLALVAVVVPREWEKKSWRDGFAHDYEHRWWCLKPSTCESIVKPANWIFFCSSAARFECFYRVPQSSPATFTTSSIARLSRSSRILQWSCPFKFSLPAF